jgi:hypothetical protein
LIVTVHGLIEIAIAALKETVEIGMKTNGRIGTIADTLRERTAILVVNLMTVGLIPILWMKIGEAVTDGMTKISLHAPKNHNLNKDWG